MAAAWLAMSHEEQRTSCTSCSTSDRGSGAGDRSEGGESYVTPAKGKRLLGLLPNARTALQRAASGVRILRLTLV